MTVRNGEDQPRTATLTVAADASELSRLRAAVTTALRSEGLDGRIVDDMELAVSELATNVIEHTSSPTITIAIGPVDGGWELEVADADGIPALTGSAAPALPGDGLTGRGLFIVHAVMDDVELVEVDDGYVIRCTKLTS